MGLVTIFATITVALICWQLGNLFKNYRIAKRIGLPILITPIGLLHPLWHVGGSWLISFLRSLPFGLGAFVEYSTFPSFLKDRYRRHERLGEAYVVVSPSDNTVVLADAAASDDILARRKDFLKPDTIYKPLETFGPNVDTVNGADWQRHRRLTAPPFNERNSDLVWREAVKQAIPMLNSWVNNGKTGTSGTENDTATLALHVLTGAGFGKSFHFEGGLTTLPENHQMTYRDSLNTILSHLLSLILIRSISLPLWLLPKSVRAVKAAMDEFEGYMSEMVESERKALKTGGCANDNLMSVLVRSTEADKRQQGRISMTDEEIYGNLFIYNLAGHDTVAGTLHHAIILMAGFPEVQEWIAEEINSVLGDTAMEACDYAEAFPKLKRCLAVMYETLRYIGAVPMLPKTTGPSPQSITVAGREVILPSQTYVFIQVPSVHHNPLHWGPDPHVWRPQRWITTTTTSSPSSSPSPQPDNSLTNEAILEPTTPGSFVPWAGGPRVCPGKKFSQVEFVATFATLFRRCRVRPVQEEGGESLSDARERCVRSLEDCALGVSIRVNRPERLRFIWEEV